MTWLLRSLPMSLSANKLRNACSGGIIFEPGSWACAATCPRSSARITGTKKNNPAIRVRNVRGVQSTSRASATAAGCGLTVFGRSSSRRLGKRAKPSSRSNTDSALILIECPSAFSSRWMS